MSDHRNIIELGHSISSYVLVLVLRGANELSALRQAGPRDSNVPWSRRRYTPLFQAQAHRTTTDRLHTTNILQHEAPYHCLCDPRDSFCQLPLRRPRGHL
jgi:hypothetical protein